MIQAGNFARTALLSLVGGSADAIGYLRFGTFVGAMTGNTVLLGIDMVEWRPGRALYHVAIVAVFLLAVIAARAALLSKLPVVVPLTLTALMLAGSQWIGSEWSAAVSAAALGLQSGTVRRIGGVEVNTAFITGDLVRLGTAVPAVAVPRRHHEVVVLATAWLAYAAGAILRAAALYSIAHPPALSRLPPQSWRVWPRGPTAAEASTNLAYGDVPQPVPDFC